MPPDVAGQCDDTVCAAGEGTRAQLRLRILSEVLNTFAAGTTTGARSTRPHLSVSQIL